MPFAQSPRSAAFQLLPAPQCTSHALPAGLHPNAHLQLKPWAGQLLLGTTVPDRCAAQEVCKGTEVQGTRLPS